MWPFGSSLSMPKLDTPLFKSLTIFTDDPTPPSRLTLEEYVEKEKWISLEKILEEDGKHFGYSAAFERWINYWVAADRYLRDSHVERYVECELSIRISPPFMSRDRSQSWIKIITEMKFHVNDMANHDRRWDTPFHEKVSDPRYYSTWYTTTVGIKGGEYEDIDRVISFWFEVTKGEKVTEATLSVLHSQWRNNPIEFCYIPSGFYREKIRHIVKLLKTVKDLRKRLFALFSEDVTVEEDYDHEKVLTITYLKEKPLFDLTEWDKANNVVPNEEEGVSHDG